MGEDPLNEGRVIDRGNQLYSPGGVHRPLGQDVLDSAVVVGGLALAPDRPSIGRARRDGIDLVQQDSDRGTR